MITDEDYCDFLVIDFLIQISNGVKAKDCKIRYTKREVEGFIFPNKGITGK